MGVPTNPHEEVIVTATFGGYSVEVKVPIRVTWDQDALAAMCVSGTPNPAVKPRYTVDPRVYATLDVAEKTALAPARSEAASKPKVKITEAPRAL